MSSAMAVGGDGAGGCEDSIRREPETAPGGALVKIPLVGRRRPSSPTRSIVKYSMATEQDTKLVESEDVPGMIEKTGPLEASDISRADEIGGKPNQLKEIDGKPISIQDAKEVQQSEEAAGHPTGKGSLPARMQAAAAVNLREGIVPPIGTKNVGTERGVISGHQADLVNKQKSASGSREEKTRT
eukprot:SM000026S08926  [mRNA]  locus=s26:570679:575264:+ [translate_table: standard]